ncbi:hypothetical protein D1AOALGA4SA_2775 [Olavius algarvensis Delta 1 endosymbiont]|nr:hypothetical protein D1AOALGA4SA_2775 [Olavius algarvensis Delta 1 endosymbiont]
MFYRFSHIATLSIKISNRSKSGKITRTYRLSYQPAVNRLSVTFVIGNFSKILRKKYKCLGFVRHPHQILNIFHSFIARIMPSI